MTSDPQVEALERQLQRLEQEKTSLERRAQRYKDILDDLPLPVCRLQPDGTVSFVNRACCEVLAQDAVDLIGRSLLTRCNGDQRQRAAEAWQRLSVDTPTVEVDCGLAPGPWRFQGIFGDQGGLEAMQASPQLAVGSAPGVDASKDDPAAAAALGVNPLDGGTIDTQRKHRVLVVDDENMVCTLAQKVLEKFDFEVVVAQTGKDALEACRVEAPFDVVLLDMSLPDIDGKQVFAAMRQLRPDIRVVISSGYDSASSGRRFTGPGVSFLPKPYMPNQLVGIIREMIDG